MVWLYLKDHRIKATVRYIVTGPRIDLAITLIAITLIDGMKDLFIERTFLTFDTKERIIEFNGIKIEEFP
jgi:hypothetical protein